ncbi:GNAT family N-acetyltransferase [Pelomicrobium sp.]|jgi:ribosomal protein S18 acetylase RimI-like enzyme|uniref:GNAT family N-acetyltransferase n=1 Tax=Pelomicrobium sp. TaxID=2815319 RepID=UPI002FDCF7A7
MNQDTDALCVRALEAQDLAAAYAVLRQLRPHLTWELFLERLARQQRSHGYTLIGAFQSGKLVGVLGMRPLETMARGQHLHIDDLVVANQARRRGVGRQLLLYAERTARERGFDAVFLDSRAEALPFYAALGYRPHTATVMRKDFVET